MSIMRPLFSIVPAVSVPVNQSKATQTPSVKKEPVEKEAVEIIQPAEKTISSLLTATPVCSQTTHKLYTACTS